MKFPDIISHATQFSFGLYVFLVLSLAGCGGSSKASWTSTGDLTTERSYHTATLLPNGNVLVAGGVDAASNSLASAELYDPDTGTWTATGNLTLPRRSHTATLLFSGKVLVTGGVASEYLLPPSAELYDPDTGTWTATGTLTIPYYTHSATLLPDGKVLKMATTVNSSALLISTELYDPNTGVWTATGGTSSTSLLSPANATLLPNGKVLVEGGNGMPASVYGAELYDPATNIWATTGHLATGRYIHTATLLSTGKVLVAGGVTWSRPSAIRIANTELYDPDSGTWTVTGDLVTARSNHTATLLPNGNVLVAGGLGPANFATLSELISKAELYDPPTGTWSATGDLIQARSGHTATLLPNGNVLVAGGGNPANRAELFWN